jgi:hypothetical protein
MRYQTIAAAAAMSLYGTLGICQITYQEASASLQIDFFFEQQTIGGGVSFYDFTHDGLDDLTLAAEGGRPYGFYVNQGGHYQRINPLVPDMENAKQILWFDYDNDSDPDLYITTYDGYNKLYRNTGNLILQEVTQQAGISTEVRRSYGACVGDYDRDGWLDIYAGSRHIPGSDDSVNVNRLYHNNANGTFTDVTESSGAADPGKIPFCSAFIDFNNDKWPDLYTANDRYRGNTLLQNLGNGIFLDVSDATGTALEMNAMSVTPGDINADGNIDIYISNTEEGNALLLNQGPGQAGNYSFKEVADSVGAGFYGIGWGAQFYDADNDADQDLYVSGMLVGAEVISSACYTNENGLFVIDADGMEGDTVSSFSNAIGDFNGDGALDIAVQNNAPFKFHFWSNTTSNANQWIKLDLIGVKSNRDGIGAALKCFTGGIAQYNTLYCGQGFLGQNSKYVHFGLKDHDAVDSLIVTWPTGHVDKYLNLSSNQVHVLTEGETTGGSIHVDPDVHLVTSQHDESHNALQEITLFPNPVSDNLFFQGLTGHHNMRLMLWNSLGQLMGQWKLNGHPVSLAAFGSGLYTATISDGTAHQICRKIIIVH